MNKLASPYDDQSLEGSLHGIHNSVTIDLMFYIMVGLGVLIVIGIIGAFFTKGIRV